ncbi:MAG: EAL domain-containing protein [Candidatus Sedimenticola endophacoides]
MPERKESITITQAIIGLAKSFDLQITAEGVERREQLDFLRREACDEIQGNYYSRPLPYEDFIEFCLEEIGPQEGARPGVPS